MKTTFYRACIELTNHRFSSKLLKAFARSKLSKPFIKSFTKTFKLDEAEMEQPVHEFAHLHDLFIRQLKKGARPILEGNESMVSPVDGVVAQSGLLKDGTTFEVKGQLYTLEEMLGSAEAAMPYQNGIYIVLYLSPRHYHRIHSPIDGEIIRQWTLGTKSYPVNDLGLRYGKRPLSRNFRIVSEVIHEMKRMAIVKVGAMNINTIELTHSSATLKKGDEMGYFSFGSTVVLIAEEGLILPETVEGAGEIKMGQQLAKCKEKEVKGGE